MNANNYISSRQARLFSLKQLLLIITTCIPQIIFCQAWVPLNNIGTIVTSTTTFAPPVTEAVCLSMNNKIYVIGCRTFTGSTSSAHVWEYDPLNDTWTEKAPYPGNGVSFLCGFSIGNIGYVGCGTGTSHALADFYKYDPALNLWTPIASIPVARTFASGFSVAGKGYVTCGETNINAVYLNDLWEYDPLGNSWAQKANLPGGSRIAGTAFGIGNNGFMGLGYGGTVALTDFYKFNPASNSWSATAAFPGVGRSGARAITLPNNAIVLSGNNLMTLLNDCYSYDAMNDTWSPFPQFPTPSRTFVLCGNLGQKIIAGGGTAQAGMQVFNDLYTIQTVVGTKEEWGSTLKFYAYQATNGDTHIRSGTGGCAFDFCLYDVNGRLIHKGASQESEVIFEGLAPNVYFFMTDKIGQSLKFVVH